MASFTYVLIPFHSDQALQEVASSKSEYESEETEATAFFGAHCPLRTTLLLRPSFRDQTPGLLAYSSSHEVPNIRATRLAMACGKLSTRFYGNVLLFRHRMTSLTCSELFGAACISPDLRDSIQNALGNQDHPIPKWMHQAAQENYHDHTILERFTAIMSKSSADKLEHIYNANIEDSDHDELLESMVVAKSPLCLECRRPCDILCPNCLGCYFCPAPRSCRKLCWSHECVCNTWKVYTDRRAVLYRFPFIQWHLNLLHRENEISEEPYRIFLNDNMKLTSSNAEMNWWRTELDGWKGGQSTSAKTVDPSIRRHSFRDGFSPLTDFPPQRPPTSDESMEFTRNELGFLTINNWEDYYRLRKIPLSSPVALLLTFPLTMYYALVTFGQVPVTVSRILQRPLRLHVVGIEKELNFLDLFQELGNLIPEDFEIEMVFVVRKDMLPPKAQNTISRIQLTTNLSIAIVHGTYGSQELDPNFDCGSGAPDMILGLNAGFYAYDSWQKVIEYLYHQNGVVGVFTDYNEYSGANCAALGGSRKLIINPFRQPRAMPVYSMNLPQISNGFMYVFNEQKLE